MLRTVSSLHYSGDVEILDRQEQVACIFCGRCVIRDKLSLDKMLSWDIAWKVLQVREVLAGPGRGKKGKDRSTGFPVVEEDSLSILQMSEDPEYAGLVEAIKGRLIMIVKAYINAGLISKDEI